MDIDILQSLPVRVDLLLLKDRFSSYKSPRKKIFDLTQNGFLFRVKRNQYFNLKSEEFKSVQVENISNSLYFPSYVSAQWALQYYGLLPDRVHTITAVTTRISREFKTPIGVFSFRHLHKHRYPCGYFMQSLDGKSFLIARPEKALLDYVNLMKEKMFWKTRDDISDFLLEDLRVDVQGLLRLIKKEDLLELLPYYHRNSKEYRLLRWLIFEKEKLHG